MNALLQNQACNFWRLQLLAATFATCLRNLNWNNVIHQNNTINYQDFGTVPLQPLDPFFQGQIFAERVFNLSDENKGILFGK